MKGSTVAKLLLCLLPALAAGIAAVYLRSSSLAGTLLQARLELDTAAIAAGLLLSALLLGLWIRAAATTRRLQTQTDQIRDESRREHRRFTERLDHELKNPLTTIRANLENLRSTHPDKSATNSIEGIDGQARRLVRLTDDLRKLAVFEDAELTLEDVDVPQMFAALESTCNATPAFADRDLVLVLPSAPWPVRSVSADGDLLELALYNLLENAAKYSDAGDTIELRAVEDAQNVRLSVADTGIGISSDDQKQMFDELFRGKHVRDRQGSGIGLTLVKRIVEKHGWTLDVTSEESRGTQVALVLPLAKRTE